MHSLLAVVLHLTPITNLAGLLQTDGRITTAELLDYMSHFLTGASPDIGSPESIPCAGISLWQEGWGGDAHHPDLANRPAFNRGRNSRHLARTAAMRVTCNTSHGGSVAVTSMA